MIKEQVAVVGASHGMSMFEMAHRRTVEAALLSPRKEDFEQVYREVPKPIWKLIPRKRTGATSFKSLMRYGDLHQSITQAPS